MTVGDHQYQYSTANQITQIAEPTNTKSYGYDAVDRLTSAVYTNPAQPNENYGYDGVGNRTSSHLSATYSHQPFNHLVSTAAATYSYDTNGNLLSKTDANGTTQFAWDFENCLQQVMLPNGSTVNYKYDALGRRIQRTPSAGTSTNFVYDGQDVLKDLNSDGSTVDYLNGPGIDNKLRLNDSRLTTGPLYFLQDHLGSTTALTNSSGGITTEVTYDGFGNSSGIPSTRYGYTGRERDPDTGLLYYRARWYDPQLGRFVSEDPIGFGGRDVNFYGYVKNGPLLFRDPSGLQRCDPIVGAILGAGLGGPIGFALGGIVGPSVGAAIGAALGGSGGTFVGPGGTLIGGGGGAAAGAAAGATAGPIAGGLIGAGIGGYIGYRICSGSSQTMDCTPPRVIPFPKPEPRPTPLFPPLPQKPGEICRLKAKDGAFCIYVCKDGYEFKTLTDTGSKHGNCPPAAARH